MFDAEAYWANRSPKKWRVELSAGDKREVQLVCAACIEDARFRALAGTRLPTEEAVFTSVELATPEDLGINDVAEPAPLPDVAATGDDALNAPPLMGDAIDDVLALLERDVMALGALVRMFDRIDPLTDISPLDVSVTLDPLAQRLQANLRKLLP